MPPQRFAPWGSLLFLYRFEVGFLCRFCVQTLYAGFFVEIPVQPHRLTTVQRTGYSVRKHRIYWLSPLIA